MCLWLGNLKRKRWAKTGHITAKNMKNGLEKYIFDKTEYRTQTLSVMKANALCWQRHLHSKGKKTQGLNSIALKYRKEILSKNTKKLRRLELGRKKTCLRKQQSHTEKTIWRIWIPQTSNLVWYTYIIHIYRERELCTKQIATKRSFQTSYNSCNNKPDVRLPKNAFRSPKAEIIQPKFWLKGHKTRL